MHEILSFNPVKGRHAAYIADGEGEPMVRLHQHIRHTALEMGSTQDPGRVWGEPFLEVGGGKFTIDAATDLVAALAAGTEKALEWRAYVGKAVVLPSPEIV